MLPDVTNMLTWWQWLIVGSIPPAVIALYFLKLKRKPVEVPSTYLWHKSIEDLHVNSLLQRLKNSLLLLLQLLALLLVILALARPSWKGSSLAGQRFVFMIDTSASMGANDVEPSRLEQARQEIATAIDSMPPGSAAMIISFSDSARVEAAFTDNRKELLRRLNLIQATQKSTDLLEALNVAAGLANPNRFGQAGSNVDVQVAEALPATLYIYSDGRTPDPKGFALGNLDPVYQMVGKPKVGNVGILAFNTQHNEDEPNKMQVFARVANYGPEPVTFPLSLYLAGSDLPLDAKEIKLPAYDAKKNTAGVESVAFNLVDFDSGVLELRAEYKDALEVDNIAWATVNPPHPANVLVVTDGNNPLLTVLSTGRAQKMAALTVHPPDFLDSDDYKKQAQGGTYNLVIFDRCAPKVMPQANTLFIGQLPPVKGWEAGEVLEGPDILDVDRSHPMMNLVEMGDVLIGKTISEIKTPTGGSTLMDSKMGPLIAIAPRQGFQDSMMSFWLVDGDRYGTTWWIRPSFPVFVLNLLTYLGGGSDPLTTGLIRPGDPLSLRGQTGGQDEIEITTPEGRKIKVHRSNRNTFDFANTDTAGVYEVAWKDRDPQAFAVNLFDGAESNILPREELKLGDGEPIKPAEEELARHEAWKLLLLLGLAVLILEWYIYNRRVAL